MIEQFGELFVGAVDILRRGSNALVQRVELAVSVWQWPRLPRDVVAMVPLSSASFARP
jgi:hypothetical protein